MSLVPSGDFPGNELPANPLVVAAAWLEEARLESQAANYNAMTVATSADNGRPSARVVLCKQLVTDPGYIVFYTNYRSRKARELDSGGYAAAVLHWDQTGRQVRIDGPAVRGPEDESDRYFATRPVLSQIGAWASDQSEPIESRAALLAQVQARAAKLGVALDEHGNPDSAPPDVARPPHWGGIRIWAERVELWVHGDGRIHDRAEWRRELSPASPFEFSASAWKATRLQP